MSRGFNRHSEAQPTGPAAALGQDDQLLLSIDDVARLLALGRRTVWRLVSAEKLPAPIRIPGTRITRWRRGDLVEWLEGLE